MNDIDTIRKMLENVGLHVRGIDANFIYIEDPACILRGFENFLYYAWMVLGLFTAGLIIGWGISMIRGAKNDIKENFKTLILIFGILTAIWPILNVIYGGDILGIGCKTMRISVNGVNEILAAKLQARGKDAMLYEDIDIYDSGSGIRPIYEMPDDASDPENNPAFSYLMNWNPNENVGDYGFNGETKRNTTDDSNYARGNGEFGRTTNSTNRPNNATNDTTVTPPISTGGRTAVSAVNLTVGEITYTAADGSKYTHVGGSLTWRANNPGALRHSNFTKRMGSIGVTSNGFAIFPNPEVGRQANIALLKTDKYQNKTLAQAIHIYAPSSDGNNPTSYAARLARSMGISVNTYLRDMSDAQIERMAEGIRSIEGWRAGDVRNH